MLHPPLHRLFFALLPPDGAIDYIASEQRRFAPGHLVFPRHFHITSGILSDYPVFPRACAERMIRAGDSISPQAIRVILNLVAASSRSIALRPSETVPALHVFQRVLAAAMRDAGLSMRPHWRFNPHMTLLYRYGLRFAVPVDAVSWLATEFVLVDSLVGLTHHEILKRWPLIVPAPPTLH